MVGDPRAQRLTLLGLLLAASLGAGLGGDLGRAEAAELRPIDRVPSQPGLTASGPSPAQRSLQVFQRQKLQSTLRRLESQKHRAGGPSLTQRRQSVIQRGPGRLGQEIGESRRDLNRLKGLEQD